MSRDRGCQQSCIWLGWGGGHVAIARDHGHRALPSYFNPESIELTAFNPGLPIGHAFRAMGWKPGVPTKPGVGFLGWKPGVGNAAYAFRLVGWNPGVTMPVWHSRGPQQTRFGLLGWTAALGCGFAPLRSAAIPCLCLRLCLSAFEFRRALCVRCGKYVGISLRPLRLRVGFGFPIRADPR